MKRLLAISLILAAALLSGCVVTPAYRYGGGRAGYYYGYGGRAAVYGSAYAYPAYDGYYDGPWVPYAGASVYYYDHDGYRRGDGYHHGDGYRRGRLATAVRRQSGPRNYRDPRRLSQPRPTARPAPQRWNPGGGHPGRGNNRGHDRHHHD